MEGSLPSPRHSRSAQSRGAHLLSKKRVFLTKKEREVLSYIPSININHEHTQTHTHTHTQQHAHQPQQPTREGARAAGTINKYSACKAHRASGEGRTGEGPRSLTSPKPATCKHSMQHTNNTPALHTTAAAHRAPAPTVHRTRLKRRVRLWCDGDRSGRAACPSRYRAARHARRRSGGWHLRRR